MSSDAVDLGELARLANAWDRAADDLRSRATAWRVRGDQPGLTAFAARAAAALTDHADVASAAAQRLRDYAFSVTSVDDAGARSVNQAMAAAASMSTAPIEEVITTPVSNA